MTTYKELLGFKESNNERENLSNLLKKAWEIRNFEIDLFWKRTAYFSAIVGAFLVAYFKIEADRYLITLLGCISSFVWFLSNLGSKFWQNNWEKHIDLLEKETQSGDIYQVILGDRSKAFSVSKLSMSFSVVAFIAWFCLYCFEISPILTLEWWLKLSVLLISVGTIAYLCRTNFKEIAVDDNNKKISGKRVGNKKIKYLKRKI